MGELLSSSSEVPITPQSQISSGYVKRRTMAIQTRLEYTKCNRNSIKETFLDEQELLEEEQLLLLGQRKFIEEDLKDSIVKTQGAHIDELYSSWRHTSSDRHKKSLSPGEFSSRVAQYLGAERVADTQSERFCSVLGIWITKCYTKCIRVVPKSFETKNLAYVFGANDAALASVRWVSIVPDGSVEANPTRWKAVVLNDAILGNTVYTTQEKIWRFEDLHNRQLTWQNDNRPAGRYLYFRYVMAIMHALYQGWVGYRDRLPSGKAWASPDKPEGYLRKSVLRSLAQMVHDEDVLPKELIEAGGFDDTDPPTGTDAVDRLAALELGMAMRRECRKKAVGSDPNWEESESD